MLGLDLQIASGLNSKRKEIKLERLVEEKRKKNKQLNNLKEKIILLEQREGSKQRLKKMRVSAHEIKKRIDVIDYQISQVRRERNKEQ